MVSLPTIPPYKSANIESKYLEAILRRYSSVTLPIGPTQGFSLQAVFQPLKLRRDPLAAEDLAHEERRALLGEPKYSDQDLRRAFPDRRRFHDQMRQSPPIVIAENGDDALRKSSKHAIVILGGPGTGKTTLLQHLVGDRARQALIDPAAPLPIFISLPDLASGKTLKECLTSTLQNMLVEERFVQVLWKALDQGKAFMCLDSLDEVPPRERHEIIRLINEWAANTNSTYVIGSRFTDYKGGQLRSEWFTEWELLPMSPPLRQKLAKRLLPELYHLMRSGAKPIEDSAAVFVDLLEHHEQVAAWSETPLLFTLAAVVFVDTGTLPSSRTMLYQKVVEAILRLREPGRTSQELLLGTVAALALELYQERGRTFAHQDMLRLLRKVRKRQDEQWSTEDMMRRIFNTGLLEVVADDTYGFRHQTFQEYLAAMALAERLISQDLKLQEEAWSLAWSKRTYSRWVEILLLMVGVLVQKGGKLGAQQAARWLTTLVKQRESLEGDPGDLGLALAVKSLDEVSEKNTFNWYDAGGRAVEDEIIAAWISELSNPTKHKTAHQRLQDLVREIALSNNRVTDVMVERLVVISSDNDPRLRKEAFSLLGNFGLRTPINVLVSALQDWSEEVRYAAVSALGDLKNQAALEPLVAAFNSDDFFMRERVMWALAELGEHVPAGLLVAALQDPYSGVRRAALTALDNSEQSVPIEAVLSIISNEEKEDIYETAIKVFGKKQVPIDFLIAASQDKTLDLDLRSGMVEILAEQGEQIPIETLMIAISNADPFIRWSAIRILGKLGERAPLEVLVLALEDEDADVRREAVEALGTQGERIPIDVLVTALKDEDADVRREAVKALGTQGERVPIDMLVLQP